MKKQHYISLVILLAGLLTSAAVLRHPHQLPLQQCSPEYQRYMDLPGIKASFVKNFPVNNAAGVTLFLDVTMLQATDSAGWERLKKDFNILPLHESTQQKIEQGADIISMHFAPKGNPSLPMDTVSLLRNNVIAVSALHRTVSIFHITTEPAMEAIVSSQFKLGITNNNNI